MTSPMRRWTTLFAALRLTLTSLAASAAPTLALADDGQETVSSASIAELFALLTFVALVLAANVSARRRRRS
jgi:hypothetical protein